MNRHELEAQDRELRKWKKARGRRGPERPGEKGMSQKPVWDVVKTYSPFDRALAYAGTYGDQETISVLRAFSVSLEETRDLLDEIEWGTEMLCPACWPNSVPSSGLGVYDTHAPDCQLNALRQKLNALLQKAARQEKKG